MVSVATSQLYSRCMNTAMEDSHEGSQTIGVAGSEYNSIYKIRQWLLSARGPEFASLDLIQGSLGPRKSQLVPEGTTLNN